MQLPHRCSCHAAFPSEAATPSAAQEGSSARSKRSEPDESQRRQSDEGLKGQRHEWKNIYYLFWIFFVLFFFICFCLVSVYRLKLSKSISSHPTRSVCEIRGQEGGLTSQRERERERLSEIHQIRRQGLSGVGGSASQHFCFQAPRSDR